MEHDKQLIFLIASSRRSGDTWSLLEQMNAVYQFPVIDISVLDISYFDYEHRNIDDDFITTIETILQYQIIGFVSPVYWYTVSAQMKTFIDRMSDLLSERKDLGRALAGKKLSSCPQEELMMRFLGGWKIPSG
ncbi:NAD(P)H-dependent oxidoreductase [bacterium]|nr:NAD(P)H-dependent oxidoreductase [bacterium]